MLGLPDCKWAGQLGVGVSGEQAVMVLVVDCTVYRHLAGCSQSGVQALVGAVVCTAGRVWSGCAQVQGEQV